MKLLFLIIALFLSIAVRADEGRWKTTFTSPNQKYELSLLPKDRENGKWSLIEKETGKTLYEITGEFISLTVLVSDDGRNLVTIDDFSLQNYKNDPAVLLFYRDGGLTKSYRLGDLMENPKFIMRSASHFSWIVDPRHLEVRDSRLGLTTFELYGYEFDALTGEILKKERDSRLTSDSVYAYGEITGSPGGEVTLKIHCLMYGKMPPDGILKFKSDLYVSEWPRLWRSVIVRNNMLIANDAELPLMNVCSNVENGSK